MAITNPVNQILVPSGNQALLAAGNRVSSLANGQLGVFNVHTGLSIDGTVFGDSREVFIAVGINRTSGGTNPMEDLNRSAGQFIQSGRVREYVVKGTIVEVPKVDEVVGFGVSCQTDYGIKIEFRSHKSYLMNGFSQFTKDFNYFSSACAGCATPGCGTGNPAEVAGGLVDNINADTDKLVTASLFAWKIASTVTAAPASGNGTVTFTVGVESFSAATVTTDTTTTAAAKIAAAINAVTTSAYKAFSTGAVITIYPKLSYSAGVAGAVFALTSAGGTGITFGSITAAVDSSMTSTLAGALAFSASFPGAGLGIRITGNAEVRPSFTSDINLKYHKTGLNFITTTVQGFESNGVVNNTTTLGYREGYGYDLKWIEYEAGGFNGKPGPYRQSSITGLQRDGFEYFIDPNARYNLLSLNYAFKSVAGWQEHESDIETLIAVPCADTTTLTGLVAVLDLIFTQFQPKANDVASMNCTGTREGLLAANVDGISSIS